MFTPIIRERLSVPIVSPASLAHINIKVVVWFFIVNVIRSTIAHCTLPDFRFKYITKCTTTQLQSHHAPRNAQGYPASHAANVPQRSLRSLISPYRLWCYSDNPSYTYRTERGLWLEKCEKDGLGRVLPLEKFFFFNKPNNPTHSVQNKPTCHLWSYESISPYLNRT